MMCSTGALHCLPYLCLVLFCLKLSFGSGLSSSSTSSCDSLLISEKARIPCLSVPFFSAFRKTLRNKDEDVLRVRALSHPGKEGCKGRRKDWPTEGRRKGWLLDRPVRTKSGNGEGRSIVCTVQTEQPWNETTADVLKARGLWAVQKIGNVGGGVGQRLKTLIEEKPLVISSAVGVAAILVVYLAGRKLLDTPSRKYEAGGSVADAYDAWTDDSVLEHYWGDHVHLGYYTDEQRKAGAFKTNFKTAKDVFVEKLMEFGGVKPDSLKQMRVLDVGCGIGGSSRLLAQRLGGSVKVVGITLSPNQVARALRLTEAKGLKDVCEFQLMDAQSMSFPDNSFDIVWVCESTEHMPDKQKVVDEIARVTKPGGKVVVAVWSQRDDTVVPFTRSELNRLRYLYDQWSHPPFISILKFKDLLHSTGLLENIRSEDWSEQSLPSWRHQLYLGLVNPLPWLLKPRLYPRLFRDAWCMNRMHQAFQDGLMQYGVISATKRCQDTS